MIDQDLEILAIQTTKLELAIRRQLKTLDLYKIENPNKAKKELVKLWTKYVKNKDTADMFFTCHMHLEYMNLLKDFEKVLDS